MIEHPIQDYAHPSLMRTVQQRPESSVSTQDGVDLVVVVRVIAVVGRRLKDGIQVDGRHAQLDKVVQALDYSQKITTLEAMMCGQSVPWFEV
jgi:uncharacterized membrane protein YjjP (DUF1212 family)